MTGVKPWQIVVMVVAVVALGASLFLFLSRGDSMPPMANQITVVDITTGDLYTVPLSGHKFMMIPGVNPESGKATLFPVRKSESGTWAVSTRDLGLLSHVQGDPKALVDRKSGQVNVTSDTPKPLP